MDDLIKRIVDADFDFAVLPKRPSRRIKDEKVRYLANVLKDHVKRESDSIGFIKKCPHWFPRSEQYHIFMKKVLIEYYRKHNLGPFTKCRKLHYYVKRFLFTFNPVEKQIVNEHNPRAKEYKIKKKNEIMKLVRMGNFVTKAFEHLTNFLRSNRKIFTKKELLEIKYALKLNSQKRGKEAGKSRRKVVILKKVSNGNILSFESITAASKVLGIDRVYLFRKLKDGKQCKGWYVRYAS